MASVAGYRILRTLARGANSTILLGFGPESAGDESAPHAGTVVVKAIEHRDDPDAGWRQAEALERARGAHVVRLLDVAADDRACSLVLERADGGDLASLLAARDRLEHGECVTVLAPLAQAIARCHAAGVAHGDLSARHVLFTADGAPVVAGFDAATLFEPGSPEIVREAVPGVQRDRDGMRGLARALLQRGTGATRIPVARFLGELDACAPEEVAHLLATRLFDLADPLPVRRPAAGEAAERATATRLVPTSDPVVVASTEAASRAADEVSAPEPVVDHPPGPVPDAASGRVRGLLPTALAARLSAVLEDGPMAQLRGALAGRWHALTPGRRRLTIAAVAAAATLLVAIVALPGPGERPVEAAVADGGAADGGFTDTTAGAQAGAPVSDPGDSAALASAGGDDPVAAGVVLLDLRDRCLRALSVLCLDGVDQSGSAAIDDDTALIRAVQRGAELPPTLRAERTPVLVERLGDSALVDVPRAGGEPVSLLLMRGGGGWRIRDYLG